MHAINDKTYAAVIRSETAFMPLVFTKRPKIEPFISRIRRCISEVQIPIALVFCLTACYVDDPCDEDQIFDEDNYLCFDRPDATDESSTFSTCEETTMGQSCAEDSGCGCDDLVCVSSLAYCTLINCATENPDSCPPGFSCINYSAVSRAVDSLCVAD